MTHKSNWKRAVININNKINFAIKKLEFAEVQILMVINNKKICRHYHRWRCKKRFD